MTYDIKSCPHCGGDVCMDYERIPGQGKCLLCSRVVWKHQIPVTMKFTGAKVNKKTNEPR